MRCRKCRHRFYTADALLTRILPTGAQLEKPVVAARHSTGRHKSSPRRNAHLVRVLVTVAVFGVMFLIFFAFLHFLSNEHSSEDNSPLQSGVILPLALHPSNHVA